MRNENVLIQFWMSKPERKVLDKRAKKSGLSRSAYLRFLVKNRIPKDLPPPDYYNMMRQLYGIANNLNQIAAKAHHFGSLDVGRYDENIKHLNHAILQIEDAVLLPEKA